MMFFYKINDNLIPVSFSRQDKYIKVYVDYDFDTFFKFYWEGGKNFRDFYQELQNLGIVSINDNFIKLINDKVIELLSITTELRKAELTKKFLWYIYNRKAKQMDYIILNKEIKMELYETFYEFFCYLFKYGCLDFFLILEKFKFSFKKQGNDIHSFYLCFTENILEFLQNVIKQKSYNKKRRMNA